MYVQKYVLVQQGDMLAVSPYESHHDPRFFQPHPARYDPTRGGLQCLGSSLHEVPGISSIAGLVFGGGRYRSALTLRHQDGQCNITSVANMSPPCSVI